MSAVRQREGGKGIPILAPIPTYEDDVQISIRFKVVYVFDVSQTDGEPIPEPPNWLSPDRMPTLDTAIRSYAASIGLEIVIDDTIQGQGCATENKVLLRSSAGTLTAIHEIAHHMLHFPQGALFLGDATPMIRELQAESVAYVVSKHFGINPTGAPAYIALWNGDANTIRANLSTISTAAKTIITALTNYLPDPQTDTQKGHEQDHEC